MPQQDFRVSINSDSAVRSVTRLSPVAATCEAHGGTWGEHSAYPVASWARAVANGDTRLGYWEWVIAQDEINAAHADG